MSGPVRLGPFLLQEALGTGGMGTVWRARHPEGVDVAVKVLKPETVQLKEHGPRLLEAFRAEVRSVASLDHPHVVRVFDYGVVPEATAAASAGALPGNTPWLAMELGDLGTLGDRAPASFDELVRVVRELLDGLAYAHARQMVHRDLKPRNVLLFQDAHGYRTALTDFGIVHALGKADANAAQAGTPGYMAPEQIRGDRRSLGPWTDLYALGCVVFRMCTGRTPYVGPTKLHVLKAHLSAPIPRLTAPFPVPDGFEDWYRILLAKEAGNRYQSAPDALAGLRSAIGLPPAPLPGFRSEHPDTTVRPRGTGLGIFLLRPWPLTGRADQQELLWGALLSARERRRPVHVAVRGGRGLGKSRLVRWIAERALETGLAESWTFSAAHPFRARLRALLRVDRLKEEEAVPRLGTWLGLHGSADPAADAARLWTALHEDAVPFGFLDVFRALAHHRPAVVVFDDLPAADPTSRAVASALTGSEAPILLVTSSDRPVEASGIPVTELELAPLAPADHRALASFAGLSSSLTEQLVAKSGGNPWYTICLATDWARQGGLVPTSHGYDFRPGFVPRLPDDLVEHARQVLQGIRSAMAGLELSVELLAVADEAPVREEEWRAICQRYVAPFFPGRLVERGIVAAVGSGRTVRYRFVDPLLRELVLQHLADAGRKASMHAAAAEALLAIPRVGAQERAIDHLVALGEVERAVDTVRGMVDEAFRAERWDRVASFLDREAGLIAREPREPSDASWLHHVFDRARLALATREPLPDGLPVALGRASTVASVRAKALSVLVQTSTPPAGDPVWTEARAAFLEAGDARGWRALLAWRARLRSTGGDIDGALEDAALAAAESKDPRERDRHEALHLALAIQHRHADAESALTVARERARLRARAEAAANWLAWTAAVRRTAGDLAGAQQAAETAAAELRAAGAPTLVADVQLGLTLVLRGDAGRAQAVLSRVLADTSAPPDLLHLARAGTAVVAAWSKDHATFDRVLAGLVPLASLDPDVPASFDRAAIAAAKHGDVARARRALELAVAHHDARRDDAAAATSRKRLAELLARGTLASRRRE